MALTTTWPLASSGTSCSMRRCTSWGCERETTTNASSPRRRPSTITTLIWAPTFSRSEGLCSPRGALDRAPDPPALARSLAEDPSAFDVGKPLGDRGACRRGRLTRKVGHGDLEGLLRPIVADAIDEEAAGLQVHPRPDHRVVLDEPAVCRGKTILHRTGDVGLTERGRGGEIPERAQGDGRRRHQMSTTIRAATTAPRSKATILLGRRSRTSISASVPTSALSLPSSTSSASPSRSRTLTRRPTAAVQSCWLWIGRSAPGELTSRRYE